MSVPALGPWEIFKSVLKNHYADFSGRARRAEYWWFGLVVGILVIVGAILAIALGSVNDGLGTIAFAILGLGYLGILIPGLALTVRRLHDTNKSGWFLLLSVIPFGGIVLLVFYCTDSDRGPNKFGPSPKYESPTTLGVSANSGTLLQ
jgi:uncharacterized membrane protein YhaH (DUF805 family)